MTIWKKYSKFLNYVFFAIITSLINIVTFWIANLFIDNVIICNVIAYAFSISSSFVINKKVVFKKDDGSVFNQGIKYLIVKFIAFVLDSLVLLLMYNVLGINKMISKIVSNMSTTISNYSLNNNWVFKKKNNKEDNYNE